MKVQNLISKVLHKAAPMLPTEFDELSRNMDLWFDKKKQAVNQKVKDEVPLAMIDKAFNLIDEWYMRALFAMLYIVLVRWVQDFMNPGEDDHPDDRDILDRR